MTKQETDKYINEWQDWLIDSAKSDTNEFKRVLGLLLKEVDRDKRHQAHEKLMQCANTIFNS